jgi:hypothetical protein
VTDKIRGSKRGKGKRGSNNQSKSSHLQHEVFEKRELFVISFGCDEYGKIYIVVGLLFR